MSPDAIHEHVKTKTEETKRLHYAAPELATAGQTTAADIFAFGICTLEASGLPDCCADLLLGCLVAPSGAFRGMWMSGTKLMAILPP